MGLKNAVLISVVAAIAVIALLLAVSRSPSPETDVAPDEDRRLGDRLDKLRSLPYTSVTDETVDSSLAGVTRLDPEKAWMGYNLYGAGKAGKVVLMDMTGRVVHEWVDPREHPASLGLPLLLPGGDVIVIQRFGSLLRLDWDSNIVWETGKRAHHELLPLTDSTFYVLEADMQQYRGLIVRFDTFVIRNLMGESIETWSTFEHLEEIKQAFDQTWFLDTLLDSIAAIKPGRIDPEDLPGSLHAEAATRGSPVFDYFHANTIAILPGNPLGKEDRRFRAGNILTCFRNVNQIAILDRDTKEVLWVWGEGDLQWPHHPAMLEDGNILIYDNGIGRKYTRIIELNPVTLEIEWQYGEKPDERFFSRTRGSCQRLPNGNTLICDSDKGRAFEVTRSGEMVWEWLNPALKGRRRVQVYRMIRLEAEDVERLLRERGDRMP